DIERVAAEKAAAKQGGPAEKSTWGALDNTAGAAGAPGAKPVSGKPAQVFSAEKVTAEIYDYIMERLRAYYLEGGGNRNTIGAANMTTEMFDAVLGSSPLSPLD